MSSDNDHLAYTRDPKHAREPAAQPDLDSFLGGSLSTLPAGGPPVILAPTPAPPPAPLTPVRQPTEAEITAKIPPVQAPPPVPSWVAQGAPTFAEHRAIDNLARVGVRSTVKMHSQRGWRGLLYRTTRINVGLSPDERYEMELYARIRRTARESHQIGILGLKGGVGKTAVTVVLGSTLSKVRGDRILAVDADPSSGNLADRVGRQSAATVTDLLAAKDLSRYNDVRNFTSINEAKLEVLAGGEYSSAGRAFDDTDWTTTSAAVSRHYNLVLADCGADMFAPAARGVLGTVSGVVIVASASIDGARQAAVTLDWMRQNGYHDLLSRSCVVVNHVNSRKPNVDTGALVTQFQKHVSPGRVFVLPWDKHIAAGTEIHLDLVRPLVQRRILELATALSDNFEGSALS